MVDLTWDLTLLDNSRWKRFRPSWAASARRRAHAYYSTHNLSLRMRELLTKPSTRRSVFVASLYFLFCFFICLRPRERSACIYFTSGKRCMTWTGTQQHYACWDLFLVFKVFMLSHMLERAWDTRIQQHCLYIIVLPCSNIPPCICIALDWYFLNLLIIHQEKTKKITTVWPWFGYVFLITIKFCQV